jgi:hypothetical protein
MNHVDQIDLIAAITKHLSGRGFKEVNPRQFNAVIEAANIIVAAYNKPHKSAEPNMGLKAWLDCDETGMSSRVMASVLSGFAGDKTGIYVEDRYAHPLDPSDFGRCVGLLNACPEMRPHIAEMATVSPTWKRLVEHWDELEVLYLEELPKKKAPKLSARMIELIENKKTASA